jgi:hypothetical protein
MDRRQHILRWTLLSRLGNNNTKQKRWGLRVIDLRAQNDSLLLRWVWTIHSDPTSLWTNKLQTQLGIQSVQDLSIAPCDTLPYFLQDLQSLLPLFRTCTTMREGGNEPQWSLTHNGCYSSKSAYKLITCPGIAQQFPHIP